jgi:hypothetical protein
VADPLTDALSVLIAHCPYIRSTRDLVTKIRVELERGYALELYFREATGQYSYTLLQGNRRVLGWDNARHHPELPNAPHHFHREDGEAEDSPLAGDPVQDMPIVAERINALFRL